MAPRLCHAALLFLVGALLHDQAKADCDEDGPTASVHGLDMLTAGLPRPSSLARQLPSDAGAEACEDTDNGATNKLGLGCTWYRERAGQACGLPELDGDGFRASEMCCTCGGGLRPSSASLERRLAVPGVPACMDAHQFAVDAVGNDCSWYSSHPGLCGKFDTEYFKASELCCACGGGALGRACPTSALSAAPDEQGLCSCGPEHECREGGAQGCPAAGGRRNTSHFWPNCTSCRCVREVPVLSEGLKVCSVKFEASGLPLTLNARIAFFALSSVLETKRSLLRSTTNIYRRWWDQPDAMEMVKPSLLQEPMMLRKWSQILLRAVLTNGEISSCGVHSVSSGEAVIVVGQNCAKRRQGVLLSGTGGHGRLLAYVMRQVEDCIEKDYSLCFTSSSFPEGWSSHDVKVAHPSANGSWSFGYGGYDPRLEEWWQGALAQVPRLAFVLRWRSLIHRVPMFGAAMALYNPLRQLPRESDDMLLLKCDMSSAALSDYLRDLVASGARCIVADGSGGLLASSHGQQPSSPQGILPEMLKVFESPDPVVRKVGQAVWQQWGRAAWSKLMHEVIPWPEMNAELEVFIGYEKAPSGLIVAYASPTSCAAGTYMPVVNIVDDVAPCMKCPPGSFRERAAGVGAACEACPPGTFVEMQGSTMCVTCQAGEFQDKAGQNACRPCPENSTSYPGADIIGKCRCRPGFWTPSGLPGNECLSCPEGAECMGKETPPYSKPQFYGMSPNSFIKCKPSMDGNPCLGGSHLFPGENECQEGYEGVGCSLCSEGFYRFGRDCLVCKHSEGELMAWWVLLLISFYLIRVTANSRYKTLYIFLTFLQVFGVQGSFQLGWSTRVKLVMRVIAVANLQIDLLVPMCAREPLFTSKYALYLAMPWVFILMDMTTALVQTCCCGSSVQVSRRFSDVEQDPDEDIEPRSRVSSLGPRALFRSIKSIHSRMSWASSSSLSSVGMKEDLIYDFFAKVLVNMRLMYCALASRTLFMLRCTHLGEGLPPRLSANMDLVCWEGKHLHFMPVVGAATLFYIIGVPLAYVIILVRGYKSNLLYSEAHLKRFGILYGRFEPSMFYWELVIMVRRVAIIAVGASLDLRTAEAQQSGYIGTFQAALMASIMVCALAVHFYARGPFNDPYQDFGEAVFLGTTFTSCVIGICVSAARSEQERSAMEVLFFCNLGLACLITLFLLWRDIELLHPNARGARHKVTKRMGIERVLTSTGRTVRSVADKEGPAEIIQLVHGVTWTTLEGFPLLIEVFKAAVCHAVEDHLKSAGICPESVLVDISEAFDPHTTLVRTLIEPPVGVAAAQVKKYMAGYSHSTLANNLLEGLTRAIGKQRITTSAEGTSSIYRSSMYSDVIMSEVAKAEVQAEAAEEEEEEEEGSESLDLSSWREEEDVKSI